MVSLVRNHRGEVLGMPMQLFSAFLVVIDGKLQMQEQRIVLTSGCNETNTLTVTWAIPQDTGPEFDPRKYLGTADTFDLKLLRTSNGYSIQDLKDWVPAYEAGRLFLMVHIRGRVTNVRMTGEPKTEARIEATFEQVAENA